MSDTGTVSGKPAARRGRAVTIVLWVLQVLLAIQFLFAGFLKVAGDKAMVDMFATIGAGQWLRYVVGILELAGGIGVLIPLLSGLAALGLSALMVGAVITNVAVLDTPPWIPLGVLVMAVLVAWGRWPWTVALAGRLRR